MMKCPVCGKSKTLLEMRPLINVQELAAGDKITEQSSEQEVGGAKLQMVCRNCWQAILDSKEKSEVIEILETLSALLLEMDRRNREQAKRSSSIEVIEKTLPYRAVPQPVPYQPDPSIYPSGPIHIVPMDPWRPNTEGPYWMFGAGDVKIDWSCIKSLGDDWDGMLANANT